MIGGMPDEKPTVTPGATVEILDAPADAQPKINPFDLELGPPFALAQGCELIERDDAAGLPGCYAAIRCSCGSMWRANLLSDDDKTCPNCQTAYTHVLAVCPTTERHMLAAICQEILEAAGVITEPDDEDEDDDEGDEDDDHAAGNEFPEDADDDE